MTDDPTPPTLRQIAAALSAVTGDYTDACHVDARPTRRTRASPTSDDVCPGCGADTCVCDNPALLETLP